jgi:hypothetical protein
MQISEDEDNSVPVAGSSKIQEVIAVTTASDWKIKVEPQEVYSLEPLEQVTSLNTSVSFSIFMKEP